MNNEQMNEVIDWLLEKCRELKIKVINSSEWPKDWPSRSLAILRIIYYNPNWKSSHELPISLAHEMGHVITQSPEFNSLNAESINLKIEDKANLVAIQLILKYIQLHDLNFETEIQLAEAFAIPDYMFHELDFAVKHQAKSNLLPNSIRLLNDGRFSTI